MAEIKGNLLGKKYTKMKITSQNIHISISQYVKMLENIGEPTNYQTVYSGIKRGVYLNAKKVNGSWRILIDANKYYACISEFDKLCIGCECKQHLDRIKEVVMENYK